MKTTILLIFFVITLNCQQLLNAQPWMSNMTIQNPTLKDYQETFNDYWKNRKIEKGNGYKVFKRWEWYWQNRINSSDPFPANDVLYKEYESYTKTHHASATEQINPSSWFFRGPSTAEGGYQGIGRLNCIAFHPTLANTYWVGSPGGGLWKTTDNGKTWSTGFDKMPVLGVSNIVVDPKNPNVLYIATGDGEGAAGAYSYVNGRGDTKSIGVLKSTNGGSTWNKTGLDWTVLDQRLIRKLLINPNDPNIIFAASSIGIYRSKNGATSWTKVLDGYYTDIEFKPNNPNIIYGASYDVSGKTAIYTSKDGGTTWKANITFTDDRRIELAVTPNFPDLVDAISCNSVSGLEGMYYSDDAGETWTTWFDAEANGINLLHSSYNASGEGGQGNYDLVYVRNPINWKEIFVGGVNTWKSPDDGNTWYLNTFWISDKDLNPNNVQAVHADKHDIQYHPLNSNRMFQCNDGGVYESTNGGVSWIDRSNGLQISQMYKISASQTKSNVVLCGLQDNGSKGLENGQWRDRTGGDGCDCKIDYKNSDIQYASYVQGVIYRTSNNWLSKDVITPVNPNDPNGGLYPGAWVSPILLDPVIPSTIYLGLQDLWVSTTRGSSWIRLTNLQLSNDDPYVLNISISPANTNIIYISSLHSLFKSIDKGNSWVLLGTTKEPITSIESDPSSANRLYITYGGYFAGTKVEVTSDGGNSWKDISGSLPNVPANCIICQKNTNQGIYLGTDLGVYYRDATKSDWELFSNNLPNVTITDLDISYLDNRLWAGTYGRGLWSSNLYNTNAIHTDKRNNFLIYQNPNDGHFSIWLNDKESNIQQIEITNNQGQVLYQTKMESTNKCSLHLNLSSGIYFIKYQVNGLINTDKFVVIK